MDYGLSQNQMVAVAHVLAADGWVSSSELSAILGRDVHAVRHLLQKAVVRGIIARADVRAGSIDAARMSYYSRGPLAEHQEG